jgi:glycosyltransferase involved in cell wall biosynthesis
MDKKKARNILGLPEKKNYAIWVGTNPELKGLPVALKAVKGLKNAYLLVVGISGINSENIISWGKVNDYRLLLILYNAADFLIFPTMYEGFPLVPLEAMACGIPIIVSKESNMGEIIREGVHGFIVKDRNPLSYKDRIELLINDTEMLNNMAIQCRSLAINYSWEKQAKRYWEIYKRICANN